MMILASLLKFFNTVIIQFSGIATQPVVGRLPGFEQCMKKQLPAPGRASMLYPIPIP